MRSLYVKYRGLAEQAEAAANAHSRVYGESAAAALRSAARVAAGRVPQRFALLLDKATSHFTEAVCTAAADLGLLLLPIPPGRTGDHQPCDQSPLRLFRLHFRAAVVLVRAAAEKAQMQLRKRVAEAAVTKEQERARALQRGAPYPLAAGDVKASPAAADGKDEKNAAAARPGDALDRKHSLASRGGPSGSESESGHSGGGSSDSASGSSSSSSAAAAVAGSVSVSGSASDDDDEAVEVALDSAFKQHPSAVVDRSEPSVALAQDAEEAELLKLFLGLSAAARRAIMATAAQLGLNALLREFKAVEKSFVTTGCVLAPNGSQDDQVRLGRSCPGSCSLPAACSRTSPHPHTHRPPHPFSRHHHPPPPPPALHPRRRQAAAARSHLAGVAAFAAGLRAVGCARSAAGR
jgi:uncharacterized membrane protein YgcG